MGIGMENNRRAWSLIGRRQVWLYHPHAVTLGQAAHDGKYIPSPICFQSAGAKE